MIATHMGQYQLGDELPLFLKTTLADAPDTPSNHPTAEIRSASGMIHFGRIPADDQGSAVGVFRGPVMLDQRFSVGRHHVIYRWIDSGSNARVSISSFRLVAGGSADGAVIAIHSVVRPQANFLLYATDDGRIIRGRNPRFK